VYSFSGLFDLFLFLSMLNLFSKLEDLVKKVKLLQNEIESIHKEYSPYIYKIDN
jgi:hypothetical protein